MHNIAQWWLLALLTDIDSTVVGWRSGDKSYIGTSIDYEEEFYMKYLVQGSHDCLESGPIPKGNHRN